MIDWSLLALPAAVLLVIPVAIVAGYRRSTGAILICGALAIIAIAAFWLVLGGTTALVQELIPAFLSSWSHYMVAS